MFFFFTIPWIFVIALVVIALGIGVSVLQFILDHIVIISIIIWLPVAWVTWTMWKYYDDDDDEKVECVLISTFSGSGVCRADTTDSDRPQCAG